MHVAFMPYGKRECVERFIRQLEAQMFKIKLSKKGKKDIYLWGDAQIRIMPFGVMELVFPKEYEQVVLNTLSFKEKVPYNIPEHYLWAVRKLLKLEKAPKVTTDEKLLVIRDNVSIIPLGVRYDCEFLEPSGIYKGWTHEAL